ncbi:MAG: hypothetical protein H0U85_06175 [Gemmatimonadales bacterium]|nr:hypothetical protein [Gemmatimonadales bacterium]
MALVTPSSPSMDVSTGELAPQITGLTAGEDLLAVAPCYIKTTDGKVYMSNGTAANEAAEFAGCTARATKSGQPTTLFALGAQFRYAVFSGQAGDKLYIAATAGRLDTTASTGDAVGVARVIDAERIQITRII